MPTVRPIPQTGEFYHIYNRGVEKRNIFLEDVDYVRFIHDLYEFNDTKEAPPYERRYKASKNKIKKHVGDPIPYMLRAREKIVDIVTFCLMSNHFHLLIRQKEDEGISKFMQKVGTGYTGAFNLRYQRVGPLFQGKYKIKHIDNIDYLIYLVAYIHLNPIDLFGENTDNNDIWNLLEQYKWSSHRDYLGISNFGSVLEIPEANNIFGSRENYTSLMKDWIQHRKQRQEAIARYAIDM